MSSVTDGGDPHGSGCMRRVRGVRATSPSVGKSRIRVFGDGILIRAEETSAAAEGAGLRPARRCREPRTAGVRSPGRRAIRGCGMPSLERTPEWAGELTLHIRDVYAVRDAGGGAGVNGLRLATDVELTSSDANEPTRRSP